MFLLPAKADKLHLFCQVCPDSSLHPWAVFLGTSPRERQERPGGFSSQPERLPGFSNPYFARMGSEMSEAVLETFVGIDVSKATLDVYIDADKKSLHVSTHGKIGRGKSFFEAAFGKDIDQYHEVLMMPEAFIIERHKFDRKAYQAYLDGGGTRLVNPEELAACGDMVAEWRVKLSALNSEQRKMAEAVIFKNVFSDETCATKDAAVNEVLRYYRIRRYDDIPKIVAED
jgi:hypothetical protein